jgi:protein involved in polysaccharide export with SLBB domain
MRDVRVLRGNKLTTRVDLYDYLVGANQTNDIRIQNDDIIFVPPRGKTVSIIGEIRRPAIFELQQGENLRQLLGFAGGSLSTAYLERIQIERIVPFAGRKKGEPERRILDVDFRSILTDDKDFTLEDGDRITVYPVENERCPRCRCR